MRWSLPYLYLLHFQNEVLLFSPPVAAFYKQDFLTSQQNRDAIIFQGLQDISVVDPSLSIECRTREEHIF